MTLARAMVLIAWFAAASVASAQALTLYPSPSAPGKIENAQLEPKDGNVRRPEVCTEQYAPVCGRLNGVLKTYPNQCYARAAGAEVIGQGPCGRNSNNSGPR